VATAQQDGGKGDGKGQSVHFTSNSALRDCSELLIYTGMAPPARFFRLRKPLEVACAITGFARQAIFPVIHS
jgi:hypothetical protein